MRLRRTRITHSYEQSSRITTALYFRRIVVYAINSLLSTADANEEGCLRRINKQMANLNDFKDEK